MIMITPTRRILRLLTMLAVLALADLNPARGQAPVEDPEGELRRLEQLHEESIERQKEGAEEDVRGREEWYLFRKRFPFDRIPDGARSRAVAEIKSMELSLARARGKDVAASILGAASWTQLGPINGGGRIRAIAVDPTNPLVIYIGAAAGGVWKSINGGETWRPTFDKESAMTMGAIGIDPNNPQIIYAGTGEPNAFRAVDQYFSDGMFKSTDGGDTWKNIGMQNVGGFSRIHVHRTRPGVVYASGVDPAGGFYRSTDGGTSWRQVVSGSIHEIAVDPENNDRLFISSARSVQRSVNAGESFTSSGSGINFGASIRSAVAMAPGDPNHLYILLGNTGGSGGRYLGAVYSSTNGGTSWTLKRTFAEDFFNNQAWYNHCITVSPADPNICLVGGIDVYRTDDGGTTWSNVTDVYPNYDPVIAHPDQHTFAFDPTNPDILYLGNDGGVYVSYDGGITWAGMNQNLPVTQFYAMDVDQKNPYRVFGGTQDNSTQAGLGTTQFATDWSIILRGDGFYTVVDLVDPNIIYGEQYNGTLSRITLNPLRSVRIDSRIGSDAGAWSTPVTMSAVDYRLYSGRGALYRTAVPRNSEVIWDRLTPGNTSLISAIGLSPFDGTKLLVGSQGGEVFYSTNDGVNWARSTGISSSRVISDIVWDPVDPNRVYITLEGYGNPHVYRSDNNGQTFVNISNNLPNIPINAIEIDPANTNHLFIGSDAGMFVSLDGGQIWLPFNNGMPLTPVEDLRIVRSTRTLIAATHGRSMFHITLDNPQPQPALVSPTGGESFNTPGDLVVQWAGFTNPVRVLISYNGGESYEEIGSNVTGSSYTYRLPRVRTTTARVRVEDPTSGQSVGSSDFSLLIQSNTVRIGNRGFVAEAITVRGDQLWASQRGSDTISRFKTPLLSNRQTIVRSGFSGTIRDMTWDEGTNLFYVLVADADGSNAHVWRMDTLGAAQGEVDLIKSTASVSGIAMVPDGLAIMSPGTSGRLFVVDPASGNVVRQTQPLTGATDADRRGLVAIGLNYIQGVNGPSNSMFTGMLERFVPIDPPTVVEKTPAVLSNSDRVVLFDIALDSTSSSSGERIYFMTDTAGNFYRSSNPVGGVHDGRTAARQAEAQLGSIVPNPIRNEATIGFTLKKGGHVTLALYRPDGEERMLIVDGRFPAGAQSVRLDAYGLESGIYYVALTTAGGERHVAPVVVVR